MSECDKLVVCNNLNARACENADGFGMVHGGKVIDLVRELWKEK